MQKKLALSLWEERRPALLLRTCWDRIGPRQPLGTPDPGLAMMGGSSFPTIQEHGVRL